MKEDLLGKEGEELRMRELVLLGGMKARWRLTIVIVANPKGKPARTGAIQCTLLVLVL